jgi:hypothetical protein
MHEPGNRSKVKRTKQRPSKDVQEKLALVLFTLCLKTRPVSVDNATVKVA